MTGGAPQADAGRHGRRGAGRDCRPCERGLPATINGLQKGMHQDQVRALLGNPTGSADTDHDGLQVHSETYVQGSSYIHAEFVNGVLVRYSIDVH